jgi:phenylalanyl-tRNA synthetase beta chain
LKVTLNWLKEFLDLGNRGINPGDIAAMLTMSGTEVKKIEYTGEKFKNIVVGKIIDYKQHPNADKLSVCQVDSGTGLLNIVCGANNFSKNDKVALALEGAVTSQGLKIGRSKLRGEVSEGMMCSEYELGLTDESEGIMILSSACTVGQGLASALGIDDVIFELEITPNRPDCLNIAGIAREISVLADIPLKEWEYDLSAGIGTDKDFEIEIKDYALCPRYCAKIFNNIPKAESPEWLKNRLIMCDYRPVDLVVDLTNYVMHEVGQPLHAFDVDLLYSKKIIVRTAGSGEQIRSIDDNIRTLKEDMLVIADEKKPVAIAGVMGGKDTEINASTTNVLLESANFYGPSIMRTSSVLGLRSEASNRFEKKLDPDLTLIALKRFEELLSEITGMKFAGSIYDNYKKTVRTRTIDLRTHKVKSVLGAEIETSQINRILAGLGIKTIIKSAEFAENVKSDVIAAEVPSFRFEDLEREIDLIEEIARIYGFENLNSSPPSALLRGGKYSFVQKTLKQLKQLLCDSGFYEVINYSFTGAQWLQKVKISDEDRYSAAVKIINPINEDFSYLRTSPLPLMVKNVINNINHDVKNIRIFEITKVYRLAEDKKLPEEKTVLGVLLSGKSCLKSWNENEKAFDFYDLKGVLELLYRYFYGSISAFEISGREFKFFHPAVSAEIFTEKISAGIIGKIHPRIIEDLDISQDIFYLELDLDIFVKNAARQLKFKSIPQFPSIVIDVALVVDKDANNSEIVQEIEKTGTGMLKEVRLFDMYEGRQVEEGKKSMAYSLTFREESRTLKDTEVDIIVKRIVQNLGRKFGATLRQ